MSQIGFLIIILSWQIYATKIIGLPMSLLGLILIGMMLMLSMASFLASKLMKKINPVKVSIIGICLSIVGFTFLYIKSNSLFFALGITFFELGVGINGASYSAWLQDYIPSSKRATFFSGISALTAFTGFFVAIGLGYTIDIMGYNFTFMLAIITQTLALLILYKFYKKFSSFESITCEVMRANYEGN